MPERSSYESTKRPKGLFTRDRVFQALAFTAALAACDNTRQTEPTQPQDAGPQTTAVIQDAHFPETVVVADAKTDKEDAEADDAYKLPALDTELQKKEAKKEYPHKRNKVIYFIP